MLLFSFIIAPRLRFYSPDLATKLPAADGDKSQVRENASLKIRETEEWRDALVCPGCGSVLVTKSTIKPSSSPFAPFYYCFLGMMMVISQLRLFSM